MKNKIIELPKIICGEVLYESEEYHYISYESGVVVKMPKITNEDVEKIRAANKFSLYDYPIQKHISFIQKTGEFWSLANAEHSIQQEAINNYALLMGYDKKMARRELNLINVLAAHGSVLHDMLAVELGSRFCIDEWVVKEDAFVKAVPHGYAMHVMVGNVPVSSIMTIIRSIITKNHTLAKLPKRDPITALYFALAMLEIDPNHPVAKSLNLFYWDQKDKYKEELIALADTVTVWGGENAVKSIRKSIKSSAKLIEFGPKSSFALVGKESIHSEKVCIDLAHDISIYNQEACFSPQMVFVENNGSNELLNTFIKNLQKAMEVYRQLLPKGKTLNDIHAHIQRARLETQYDEEGELVAPKDTNWTIIKVKDPSQINQHPLSRVLYVIPINHITDCIQYVNNKTQTIVMSPWHRNTEIRDAVVVKGACKITEIGMAEWQRVGQPHDDIFPLAQMVRWVGVERGLDYWGKFIQDGPIDTTKWLMMSEVLLEQVEKQTTELVS